MSDHPGSGIKPMFLELAGRFFTTEPPGKPIYIYVYIYIYTHIHIYTHTYIYIGCIYIYIGCVYINIYIHTSVLQGYIMSDCCDNTDTLTYYSELPEKSPWQRKNLTVPRPFEVMPWSSRGREPTAEHLDLSYVRGIPLQVKRISVQFYKINFWNVTNILNVESDTTERLNWTEPVFCHMKEYNWEILL